MRRSSAAELIAERRGLGDALAEGVARFAKQLGPDAEHIAVTVKGKEFPAHTPTSKAIMGLIYAVSAFGPDHMSSEHETSFGNGPTKPSGLGSTRPSGELWDMNLDRRLSWRLAAVHQRDRLMVRLRILLPHLDDLHP